MSAPRPISYDAVFQVLQFRIRKIYGQQLELIRYEPDEHRLIVQPLAPKGVGPSQHLTKCVLDQLREAAKQLQLRVIKHMELETKPGPVHTISVVLQS